MGRIDEAETYRTWLDNRCCLSVDNGHRADIHYNTNNRSRRHRSSSRIVVKVSLADAEDIDPRSAYVGVDRTESVVSPQAMGTVPLFESFRTDRQAGRSCRQGHLVVVTGVIQCRRSVAARESRFPAVFGGAVVNRDRVHREPDRA
jgi:hypothetical protein